MSLKLLLAATFVLAGGVALALFLWPTGIEHPNSPWVNSLAFSPDCQTLATAGGNQICVWNVVEDRQVNRRRDFGKHANPTGVAFSPDGNRLACWGYEKNIRLFDTRSGRELGSLIGHQHYVKSVAFHPKIPLLASGSADKSIRLWNLNTGKQIGVLGDGELPVQCVAISPDGQFLASSDSKNTIYIFDLNLGTEIQRLHGHEFPVEWVSFSPVDSFTLASAGHDHLIQLWDWKSGKIKERYKSGGLGLGAWSPDGKALAFDGPDYNIQMIEVGSEKAPSKFPGAERVKSVSWSSDGLLLGIGGWNGKIMVFEIGTGKRRF